MQNKRDIQEVLKSILKLLDEAKNLEKGIGEKSSKKLDFKTDNILKKSKVKSYSDWSGKKFTYKKIHKKQSILDKKISIIFEKELSKWIKINKNKNQSSSKKH